VVADTNGLGRALMPGTECTQMGDGLARQHAIGSVQRRRTVRAELLAEGWMLRA